MYVAGFSLEVDSVGRLEKHQDDKSTTQYSRYELYSVFCMFENASRIPKQDGSKASILENYSRCVSQLDDLKKRFEQTQLAINDILPVELFQE